MSNTTCGLRGCLPGRCGTATTDSSGHARGSRLGPAKWLADTGIRRAFCLLVQWTRRLARPLRWLFLSGRTVRDEARNSELSLVALIGPSGCGKSTFAAKHFLKTEVISSDFCRGLVSDDENDQASTKDAFDVLHFIVRKRLALRRLAVVDATNVQQEARKPLVAIAREYHAVAVAIVFRLPEELCRERNRGRPDRDFGAHVVRQQHQQMRRSIRGLEREGFRYIYVLNSPEQVESVQIERQPLWTNLRHEHGPFDIIGDVHGCFDDLMELLGKLGYDVHGDSTDGRSYAVGNPAGRKLVFLGDLVDRGPNSPGVMRLVMSVVRSGAGFCVAGNHDVKLSRALKGRNVQVTHGLAESLEQLGNESDEFKREVAELIENLRSHYVLD